MNGLEKLKKCCRCKRELPVSSFHKDRSKKDGLNGMCKECMKEQNKKYYEEKREEIRIYFKERRRKLKRKATRKRAREKREKLIGQLPNTLTEKQWHETLREFDYSCAYCGRKSESEDISKVMGILQKDHLVPVVAGGGLEKWNVVPACLSCNASKGDKHFLDWYIKQPTFSAERLTKITEFVRKHTPLDEDNLDEDEDDLDEEEDSLDENEAEDGEE